MMVRRVGAGGGGKSFIMSPCQDVQILGLDYSKILVFF